MPAFPPLSITDAQKSIIDSLATTFQTTFLGGVSAPSAASLLQPMELFDTLTVDQQAQTNATFQLVAAALVTAFNLPAALPAGITATATFGTGSITTQNGIVTAMVSGSGGGGGPITAASVSNVPSGSLAATDVQGALDELQTDVDRRLNGLQNMGTGAGLYIGKSSGTTPNGQIKSLIAGTGISITPATNDITIAVSGSYQPLDADLTAIAGLAGTSGLLKKTAADTWTLDTTVYAPNSSLASYVLKAGDTMSGPLTLSTLQSSGASLNLTSGVLNGVGNFAFFLNTTNALTTADLFRLSNGSIQKLNIDANGKIDTQGGFIARSGYVEAGPTSSGFKFPDGTVQTTAAVSGGGGSGVAGTENTHHEIDSTGQVIPSGVDQPISFAQTRYDNSSGVISGTTPWSYRPIEAGVYHFDVAVLTNTGNNQADTAYLAIALGSSKSGITIIKKLDMKFRAGADGYVFFQGSVDVDLAIELPEGSGYNVVINQISGADWIVDGDNTTSWVNVHRVY